LEGEDRGLQRFGSASGRKMDAEALEDVNKVITLERFCKEGAATQLIAAVYCLAVGKCREHYNGQVF